MVFVINWNDHRCPRTPAAPPTGCLRIPFEHGVPDAFSSDILSDIKLLREVSVY
jgi:hypothetical protein